MYIFAYLITCKYKHFSSRELLYNFEKVKFIFSLTQLHCDWWNTDKKYLQKFKKA